jgi:hypothetical protein
MSYRSNIIKEYVDVQVTAPNNTFKGSFEVDKHVKHIIGIALTSNFEDRIYYRGSQRISINEKEIYPENYESKLLMQGLNVAANDRIIKIDEGFEPGNRKVEIAYKDTDHPYTPFIPYSVRLYVYSQLVD